jgi:hypothetical protein
MNRDSMTAALAGFFPGPGFHAEHDTRLCASKTGIALPVSGLPDSRFDEPIHSHPENKHSDRQVLIGCQHGFQVFG